MSKLLTEDRWDLDEGKLCFPRFTDKKGHETSDVKGTEYGLEKRRLEVRVPGR